ncbi:tubulin binding cofactor C-domain-containing protein [Truncatella angustata]|uniref:Tubulin binding cofactor C-domain-containing protein n=1 Tax=Truncatella angustata TaxID=152316 RepID=A0A9P8ZVI7_9PEZI|nr:tubulin binding cofactor C-domain-containing protein [Truncatella angustata]KAH6651991.1 tubulin binding cofactor C-domain-containing protein [Truncatella angustata]
MSDPKERFYRHFQTEITSIQDQIEDLATVSPVGGERQDCVDTILAGISRLTNEVGDARDFIPAYDQRTYSQAIKALTEKLNEATGRFASKSRFHFKPRASANPQQQRSEDTTRQQEQRADPRKLRFAPDTNIPEAKNPEETDSISKLPTQFGRDYNEELSRPSQGASIRKPSFSSAKTIAIYSQSGLHIMLPPSASRATSSGSLTDLDRCVVDMTVPTLANSGVPFAGLAIKNVRRSLLICGTVAGPVHITGVRDSVVVVAARQVRVHECENVNFYLWCGSHPIIEDCRDVRFAPLPETYAQQTEDSQKNQWDQVDDFKWLKSEPSPNWSILTEDKRVAADVWSKDVGGNPSLSTDGILRKVGLSI